MKALILAAGAGTRLRPLTDKIPKPMLRIARKPVLAHILAWLKQHEICDVAVNLHHQPESLVNYFGDGRRHEMCIHYSRETEILGTAGAIRKLSGFFDAAFVVVYGDVLTDLDLTKLIRLHKRFQKEQNAQATLALYRVTNPTECGIVDLANGGRVLRIVEKPRPEEVFTDLASAGVLVMEPEAIQAIPADRPSDIGRDLLPTLLDAGRPIFGAPIESSEYLIDMGTLANFQRARREWPCRLRPRPKVHNGTEGR